MISWPWNLGYGHSRSLKMVPFESLRTVFYLHFIVCCQWRNNITEMWQKHFEELYNSTSDSNARDSLLHRITDVSCGSGGVTISIQDVAEACIKQKYGKAVGLDGIAMETFIYGGPLVLVFTYANGSWRRSCNRSCLSVSRITAIIRFYWNLVLWLGLRKGESINSWWWFGRRYRFCITFPLPQHCRIGHFRAFLIQPPAAFHDIRRNDWSRQGNESTTFWERSGGHPELDPDSNLGQFLSILDTFAGVCSLWVLSSSV